MERTTWGKINELFEAARRMPAGEREAWLRAATNDERVRSEVISLLHAHEDDPWSVEEPGGSRTPARVAPTEVWPGKPKAALPGALSAPPGTGRRSATPASPSPLRRPPEAKAGSLFATYRLIREIARDPARIIFEAAATGGSARPRVALHVLAADARAPAFAAQLHAQSDILANLDHPGIPRLLDGGVTGDGTAYLAFEYAAGDPVDDWCRERSLKVRDRVDLVLAACEAVRHAHEHLIAHGDLRPANIRVSADAEVRLLDCGMSPLIGFGSSPGGSALMHHYMSPEQASGEVLTAASDVYGLGMLLYTLLTGYPPYELGGQTPARARHMICTIDADVPSTVVSGRDRRALTGTLDHIILKALRKNPRDRYPTAAALAADLRAWRDGRPASVRPTTAWSRLAAAWDGRALRIGTLGVAVALLAGIGVLGWQGYLLRVERDQARASVADGFRRLAGLQASGAGAESADRAAAVTSLNTAIAAGEQVLAANPRSLPAVITLAGAYGALLGLRLEHGGADAARQADARLRALVDQLGRAYEQDAAALAAAASGYTRLGAYREAAGDTATAKALYGDAVAAFERLAAGGRLAGASRADQARAQRRLGAISLREGAVDVAERLLLAAQAFDADLAAGRTATADAKREMADTANGLAMVARRRGDAAKAEELWTQALTALQAVGDTDPRNRRALEGVAEVRASLGSLCRSQRRFEDALAHYREALRAREREAGLDGAGSSAPALLATARTDVARLVLDLVETRQPGPTDAARLREAGALLAEAAPALRNGDPVSPAQQDAVAELDRQTERLRGLSKRRR